MHAALKPYLMSLVQENADKAVPVMRPLFYHYDEPKAYTETSEYLLGKDLLVAPVLCDKARSRTVYLPQDEWVHLFTEKEFTGGSYEVEAKLGWPPVFVRKNSKNYDALMELSKIKL